MADPGRQIVTTPWPATGWSPRAEDHHLDGVPVELHGHAQVGTTSELTFHLTDARSGQLLRDLQPYLAAAGHIVVMRADGQTFAHEHADAPGIPVIIPGERITAELLEYLRTGLAARMQLPDPADSSLKSIRIVSQARS